MGLWDWRPPEKPTPYKVQVRLVTGPVHEVERELCIVLDTIPGENIIDVSITAAMTTGSWEYPATVVAAIVYKEVIV